MPQVISSPLVCPNCGEFTELPLNEETGWCQVCSPDNKIYSKLNSYLEKNADEIEHYIAQGHSLNKAIDLLHHENGRPHCLVCGEVIKRAPNRSAIFCRRNPMCRKMSRRYVYLYTEKGLTKSQALAQVIADLS